MYKLMYIVPISGTLLTNKTCVHTFILIYIQQMQTYKVHDPPLNVEQTTFLVVMDLLIRDCMNSQQLGLCLDVFLVEVGLGLHEAHHLQCLHV